MGNGSCYITFHLKFQKPMNDVKGKGYFIKEIYVVKYSF